VAKAARNKTTGVRGRSNTIEEPGIRYIQTAESSVQLSAEKVKQRSRPDSFLIPVARQEELLREDSESAWSSVKGKGRAP
jgi:hypothetical protein